MCGAKVKAIQKWSSALLTFQFRGRWEQSMATSKLEGGADKTNRSVWHRERKDSLVSSQQLSNTSVAGNSKVYNYVNYECHEYLFHVNLQSNKQISSLCWNESSFRKAHRPHSLNIYTRIKYQSKNVFSKAPLTTGIVTEWMEFSTGIGKTWSARLWVGFPTTCTPHDVNKDIRKTLRGKVGCVCEVFLCCLATFMRVEKEKKRLGWWGDWECVAGKPTIGRATLMLGGCGGMWKWMCATMFVWLCVCEFVSELWCQCFLPGGEQG